MGEDHPAIQPSPGGRQSPQDGAASSACREAAALDGAGQHMQAIALLSRAAAGGDLLARRTVGLRILLGDRAPLLGPQGVTLLRETASDGDALSADLVSILSGAGIHCTQDWGEALHWLQYAAELGSPRARGALGVLCTDPDLAARAAAAEPERALWGALRADIDLGAWLTPPPGRDVHGDPLVRAYAGFASPRLCAWLMAQACGRLSRAEVYNPHTGSVEQTGERTNSAALFSLLDTDLAQIMMQMRIAAAVGTPFAHLEPAAVLHYSVGQAFEDHYDFVDPQIPEYAQDIARNGQRVVTFLLYLNDDYSGGTTDFPRLALRHKGRAGDAMFFVNVRPGGVGDTRTLHAGRPPQSGEKWVLTQFVRDRVVVPGLQPG